MSMDIAGSIEFLLSKTEKKIGRKLSNPSKFPQNYVRDMFAIWRELGGMIGGKTRHSEKFLDEALKKRGIILRSLNPKLGAKARTNLSPIDAKVLIEYFMENWPSVDDGDNSSINYGMLLEAPEIRQISSYLAELITEVSEERPGDGDDEVAADEPYLPGEDVALLITRYFEDSDALITVAPEHVLIAAYPRTELIGFKSAIDRLWAIERRDKKFRPLIWVVGAGGTNIDDESSRRKFLNIQSLIARFKAMKRYVDMNSEKRLDWLQSRCVIIVLDIDEEGTELAGNVSNFRRPSFSAHHVSLTTTANEWLADSRFRALYGSALQNLDQRNFSIFYRASGWPESGSDLKYVGHALFKHTSERGDYVGRGLELGALPGRYEVGFRTVCAAAFKVLDMPEKAEELLDLDGRDAHQKLNYLGFLVLRLDEFVERY